MPLPGDETLPETDDNPLLGSGFSFLKAPSAAITQIKPFNLKLKLFVPLKRRRKIFSL